MARELTRPQINALVRTPLKNMRACTLRGKTLIVASDEKNSDELSTEILVVRVSKNGIVHLDVQPMLLEVSTGDEPVFVQARTVTIDKKGVVFAECIFPAPRYGISKGRTPDPVGVKVFLELLT